MTIKEINEKSEAELDKELAVLQGAVRDMRFKLASRQLKAVRSLRQAKKTIARILTVLAVRRQAARESDRSVGPKAPAANATTKVKTAA